MDCNIKGWRKMDFKSGKKSIGGLFSCKKQFVIPRFQREYTWGKIELNEFLDDILSRIEANENGTLDTSEYFWGSLLLVGDLDDQKILGVDVVDGQAARHLEVSVKVFRHFILCTMQLHREEHQVWKHL